MANLSRWFSKMGGANVEIVREKVVSEQTLSANGKLSFDETYKRDGYYTIPVSVNIYYTGLQIYARNKSVDIGRITFDVFNNTSESYNDFNFTISWLCIPVAK